MHRRYNPTCSYRSLVLDPSDYVIISAIVIPIFFAAHLVGDGELQFLRVVWKVEAEAKVVDVGSTSTDEFGWAFLVGLPIVHG